MAIMDTSLITDAIEDILKQKCPGYNITCFERKNVDPSKCRPNGWVGIYSDADDYEAHTIGATPWLLTPNILINVQVVENSSGKRCRKKLTAAIRSIVAALESDRTLNSTILNIKGYSIEYEYNDTQEIYYYGANIKLKCETRA